MAREYHVDYTLVQIGIFIEQARACADHLVLNLVTAHRHLGFAAAIVVILFAVLAIAAITLELISVGIVDLARQQIISVHLASPFPTSGCHVRMSAVPKIALDNGRHSVFFPEIAPGVGAYIALAMEQTVYGLVAKRPAGDGLVAKAVEPAHDLCLCLACGAHVKGHAHACRLMLVDSVVSIDSAVIPKNRDAVMLALEGIPLHPAPYVLREIGAIEFGHSLKHRFEDDAVGTVRHRFGGGYDLHATFTQFRLIDGRIVARAREAVGLVDDYLCPALCLGIENHLLKAWTPCGVGTGSRFVGVGLYNLNAIGCRELGADAHLVLNRFLALLI